MSDAQLFQYANTTALLSWIILVFQPKRTAPILRVVIPVAMALLYIWALSTAPANPDGGFGSLAEVKALFTQDRAVLAGWVHYLAFDLFVGCWMTTDANARGIKHLLVVPCLVLTFMFGPAGLLLYFGLRAVSARSGTVTAP
ncbi:MAG: ABA4-like family protein [Gemmatimonadaceae bacterium]|nr:ABA4-like family protein [Gemmatimonadaceae bacterium]